jgi:hypothetical protein
MQPLGAQAETDQSRQQLGAFEPSPGNAAGRFQAETAVRSEAHPQQLGVTPKGYLVERAPGHRKEWRSQQWLGTSSPRQSFGDAKIETSALARQQQLGAAETRGALAATRPFTPARRVRAETLTDLGDVSLRQLGRSSRDNGPSLLQQLGAFRSRRGAHRSRDFHEALRQLLGAIDPRHGSRNFAPARCYRDVSAPPRHGSRTWWPRVLLTRRVAHEVPICVLLYSGQLLNPCYRAYR